MKKTPDPAPASEQALVPNKVSTRYDPFGVDRRRREVAKLRYTRNLTEPEIKAELLKLDPPIDVSVPTISRDLHAIRRQFNYHLSARGFDAAEYVFQRLTEYAEREDIAMEAARTLAAENKVTKASKVANCIRAANEATRQATRLLQDTGMLDRRLGTLVVDDGKKVERVPAGAELQKLFESVIVTEGEITSEAEVAWNYGDAALAEAAARAATDSAREVEGQVSDDD